MPAANPYGNAYYDPGSLYGSPTDYSTAPIVAGPGGFLSENPQADWTRFIAPFASGNDPFSTWVRAQYSRAYQGYNAAQATNPSLLFGHGDNNYLSQLGSDFFANQWNRLSSEQRGLNLPRYGAGRTQWLRM
jgi:hypothetical protein